jgi:hypothetical protein
MATIDNGSSTATPWLAFLIGALIVAVVVLGFVVFTGGHIPGLQPMPSSMNVTVKAPPAPTH